MHIKYIIPTLGLSLISTMACHTKLSDKENHSLPTNQPSKNTALTKYDTVLQQLGTRSEIKTQDLVDLGMIDTSVVSQFEKNCNSDTTVQVNDSIYYSIIRTSDKDGICSYFFLTSINRKRQEVVASQYLHPDCDVDFSSDTYQLYEHFIASKDEIEVIHTTIFQKKNRVSADEEQNIDRKQTKKGLITISQTGQINAK